MKKILTLTILLSISYAQESNLAELEDISIENQIIKKIRQLDDSEKLKYYEQNKKNAGTAIVFSTLVPTAGHAYVGNWGRGCLFLLPVLGTTMYTLTVPGEQIELIMISGIIMHILQIADSGFQANKHNTELYQKLFLEYDFTNKKILPKDKGYVGLGLGPSYGLAGLNFGYKVKNNLHATVGIGNSYAGTTSSIGLKYYLKNATSNYRPVLTLLYGVNQQYVKYDYSYYGDNDIYEKFNGISCGIGLQRMFGKTKQHGLDINLVYLATSEAFEYAENNGIQGPPNFTFSFGYRFGY